MKAVRLAQNPIITGRSHPTLTEHDHTNINGPSLIRVPDFVPRPLGRYYLYFAHHQGTFIRLAYADDVAGPWTVHEPGSLHLSEASSFKNHVASPDVHVDAENRRLVMYAHGPAAERGEYDQVTAMFTSSDGLRWTCATAPITNAYLRVFRHAGMFYGIAMPGRTWRAPRWDGPFEQGPMLFGARVEGHVYMRHGAVLVRGDTLTLFYSRVGDNPEHIVASTVDLTQPFERWTAPPPVSVLRPDHDWEGADQPMEPSSGGARHRPVHQLRDPAVFEDPDTGQAYLLYSTAGEQGIAAAKLTE